MARKSSCRATPIVKKPVTPIKEYMVTTNGSVIIVKANQIKEDGDTLIFSIVYQGKDYNETDETIAMFKEWDHFVELDTVKAMQKIDEFGKTFESLKQTK